jgi:hypothetical protein
MKQEGNFLNLEQDPAFQMLKEKFMRAFVKPYRSLEEVDVSCIS